MWGHTYVESDEAYHFFVFCRVHIRTLLTSFLNAFNQGYASMTPRNT